MRGIFGVISAIIAMALVACGSSAGGGSGTDDLVDWWSIDASLAGKDAALVRLNDCTAIQATLRQSLKKEMESYLYRIKDECRSQISYDDQEGTAFSSPDYTDTNIQESGVDEADVVKTDGRYAFVVSGQKVRIARVWPVQDIGSVAEISVDGIPSGLFLARRRLVVESQDPGMPDDTIVSVFDISDPAKPVLVWDKILRGNLISGRRIDNKMFLALDSRISRPTLSYQVDWNLIPECGDDGKPAETSSAYVAALKVLRDKNRRTIESFDFSDACGVETFYRGAGTGTSSIIDVVSLDLGADTDNASHTRVFGAGSMVYASNKAIYVTEAPWKQDKTFIHKFALGVRPDYSGSIPVDGRILNQFSMGEYEGVLRVATTSGFGSKSTNAVYTLDVSDQKLAQIARLDGIAPGESIYAVRFIGARGFVVTFRQIDPLFVLDLSDARRPNIAGELKVPGFSTYLHPVGDDHIIGLGHTETQWSSLKLSLFDVGDSANPVERDTEQIGGPWSDSPALTDHHAFTFDSQRHLLALPVDEANESGIYLYRVTPADGFVLVGKVTAMVERSILIGDGNEEALITVEADGLSVRKLDGQLTEIGSVLWKE